MDEEQGGDDGERVGPISLLRMCFRLGHALTAYLLCMADVIITHVNNVDQKAQGGGVNAMQNLTAFT